jgi:hypothetical protein
VVQLAVSVLVGLSGKSFYRIPKAYAEYGARILLSATVFRIERIGGYANSSDQRSNCLQSSETESDTDAAAETEAETDTVSVTVTDQLRLLFQYFLRRQRPKTKTLVIPIKTTP